MVMKTTLSGMRVGALLGVITGLVGSLLAPLAGTFMGWIGIADTDLAYIYSAGMMFGLALGLYLRSRFSIRIWQVAVFILAVPAIYYGAVMGAKLVFDKIDLGHEMAGPGLVGGAIGAGLVALLTCMITRPQNWVGLTGLTIAAGAIAGALALPLSGNGPDMVGLIILHVPWHAAVLAVLLSQLARSR